MAYSNNNNITTTTTTTTTTNKDIMNNNNNIIIINYNDSNDRNACNNQPVSACRRRSSPRVRSIGSVCRPGYFYPILPPPSEIDLGAVFWQLLQARKGHIDFTTLSKRVECGNYNISLSLYIYIYIIILLYRIIFITFIMFILRPVWSARGTGRWWTTLHEPPSSDRPRTYMYTYIYISNMITQYIYIYICMYVCVCVRSR